jgi:hypothetical protein
MRRNYFFAIMLVFMIACNNKKNAGWTGKQEDEWMALCIAEAGGSPKAKEVCSCVLGKIEKKYPSYEEADRKGTEAEGRQMAQECMGTSNNNNNGEPLDNSNREENTNTGGAWSESDRDTWAKQCMQSMNNVNASDQAKQNYCDCIGEKLEKRYSNFNEMNTKGTQEEGMELGKQCSAALTGGGN